MNFDTRTRAGRYQDRDAQRRKLWLMVAAVISGLFVSVGAYAVGFFQSTGAPEPSGAAGKAQAVRSQAPAFETTEGTVASRGGQPTRDASDKPAPRETPKASGESLTVLVLGV